MNHPYHINFLKDFPALGDWLSLNGFSMVYSIMSFETNTILSMWSDQCFSEDKVHTAPNATNCIILSYCRKCKTVEVYARGYLGSKGTDMDIAGLMRPLVTCTVTDYAEKILNGEKQYDPGDR